MRDMFGEVVTHRARLRNSIVAPFASIPILIVALFACWSLFTIVLPMPVVEAISFVQIDVRPPALPSLPTRRVESKPNSPATNSPVVPPLAPPDGFKPEIPRVVDVADKLPIGEIPGAELSPSVVTNEVKSVPTATSPVAVESQKPVIVGGLVKAPTRIKNVSPIYPAIAQSRACKAWSSSRQLSAPAAGDRRENPAIDSAAGLRGTRGREAVGVHHADTQRSAGAGHHDRHGQLHVAVAANLRRRMASISGGPLTNGARLVAFVRDGRTQRRCGRQRRGAYPVRRKGSLVRTPAVAGLQGYRCFSTIRR